MTPATAERRAWQILIASFVTFLLICSSAIYASQWFVFRSTVPLNATLTVARGTVRLITPGSPESLAVTDSRAKLETGTLIQTDATSQAIVSFGDPTTNQPLGALVVYRDSQVRLRSLVAPQFALNPSPYQVSLFGQSGRGYAIIFSEPGRPLFIHFATPNAESAMVTPGQLTYDISELRTVFGVVDGEFTFKSLAANQNMAFKTGSRVSIDALSSAVTSLADETRLVINSDFSRPYSVGWTAYDHSEPVGSVYNSTIDGRGVVVIDRSQARWPQLTLNHGETGITQAINADVSNMNALELRATLLIDEQNLSTCGVVGSECPLMIRVTYVDPAGATRAYIHGFYANHDPGLTYPLLCDTCRAEHERINPRNWYTFSENLLALIPQDQRPITIKEISLYASGHAYKVFIDEAALIGAREVVAP